MVFAEFALPDHVYDVAEVEAVITALSFTQISVLDAMAVTVGLARTLTVTVALAEQVPLDPVTVYTVLAEGITVVVAVFPPAGIHV